MDTKTARPNFKHSQRPHAHQLARSPSARWLGGRDRNHRNIEDVQANLSRAIIEEKICHENMRELLLPTSP